MSTQVDADGVPILSDDMKTQLKTQAYDISWLQTAGVTPRMVDDYATKAKQKVQDLLRNDGLKIGDELQFGLPNQQWRVRLVASSKTSFFAVDSVAPAQGLRAENCTGFSNMIGKLQHALDPTAAPQPASLYYKDLQVFRNGQALGTLAFVRSARAMYDKAIA
ncbi:MAG: hypothetical protein LQ338_000694 [Usnochroma carphineum]|nr:MAG: hypothetical protein LQ338_000694 [Usnochroma carphineum]